MNKEEALAGLDKLRKAMQELTDLQSALGTIQDNIDALKNYIPHALNDFDLAHKDAYIISNIGEAPPKPGKIQQILPWTKKEVQAYNAYLKQYNEFEDKYYEEFSEQRKNVRAEEEKIVQSEMDDYINRQKVYLKNSEELKESIETDTLLDKSLKTRECIESLISFLHLGRADTLKEAINLFFVEQYHQHLEKLVTKQTKLIRKVLQAAEESKQLSDKAYKRADEAYGKSEEAFDRANEAFDKADDAFYQADRAYEKADEALDRVHEAD